MSAPEPITLRQALQPRKRKREPPRPMKLVWLDGRIVGDATVIVSPCDKNWWHNNCKATNGEIKVRRQP
jgi:hypothetical protein